MWRVRREIKSAMSAKPKERPRRQARRTAAVAGSCARTRTGATLSAG